jgi:glycosyltransferase involved in cell wall biosynthesis
VRLFLTRPGPIERAAREHGVQLLWFVGTGVHESPDIPYLATVWDLQHRVQPFFPEVSSAGLWDKRELFNRYFVGRAAFCITGTEAGKREIERFYGLAPGRGRVIPFPTPSIEDSVKSSNLDMRERFGCDRKFVLYPGQFWPHKNHANLILALKWLRETRDLDLGLVLPGTDKGNLSFIKAFCREKGMDDRVYCPGFVSTEELIALYRQAEVLAFVTYFGPDNIPPLEAFALGCPVVCSEVDGAAEQYGDAAIRVHPSKPHEIGRAIESVITDRVLRDRLVTAGFKRAALSTPESYIREVYRIIDEFADVRRNWP